MATTFAVLCVCLQPLVEDTGYKTLLRLVFLVLAGLIGFGVMSSYRFATNPAAIMALLCLVSFIFGHMNGVLAIKYPMFFFMVTIYSMLLSQYTGHSQGTLQFFGGQVLATLIGSSLCLIFGVLLLPWYASQHALEQLADALTSCMSLSERMWDDFGKAAQEAAASGKDIQMPAAEYGQLLKTKVDKLLVKWGRPVRTTRCRLTFHTLPNGTSSPPMPPVVKTDPGRRGQLGGPSLVSTASGGTGPLEGQDGPPGQHHTGPAVAPTCPPVRTPAGRRHERLHRRVLPACPGLPREPGGGTFVSLEGLPGDPFSSGCEQPRGRGCSSRMPCWPPPLRRWSLSSMAAVKATWRTWSSIPGSSHICDPWTRCLEWQGLFSWKTAATGTITGLGWVVCRKPGYCSA
eukprot:jgi/Botrbrau1/16838/Bobra.150_2s0062.1